MAQAPEIVGAGSRRVDIHERMGTGGEWTRLQLVWQSSHRLGRHCASSPSLGILVDARERCRRRFLVWKPKMMDVTEAWMGRGVPGRMAHGHATQGSSLAGRGSDVRASGNYSAIRPNGGYCLFAGVV